MRGKSLIINLLLIASCALANAAECDTVSRPVTQIYSLEIGGISTLDTYLSPLRYGGVSCAATGLWTKAMPFSPKWTMDFDARAEAGRSLSPSQNSLQLDIFAQFVWGMNRRWQLPGRVMLSIGTAIDIEGGVLYMPRNSNNPASAKCRLSLNKRFAASWPFKIGNLPILLSDRVTIPTIGALFSPAYGEPYYEIYLGNHSGLVHFGWCGNNFCLDNLLAVTLDFGRTAMQLGYRFRCSTSYVNHLNTELFTNAFSIGVIPHGLGLKQRRPCDKTLIINALY